MGIKSTARASRNGSQPSTLVLAPLMQRQRLPLTRTRLSKPQRFQGRDVDPAPQYASIYPIGMDSKLEGFSELQHGTPLPRARSPFTSTNASP